MVGIGWIVGLIAIAQGPSPTAADSITLRDGQVVLGQILDSDRRGPIPVLVRRAWADAHLPDRSAQWRKAEAPIVQKASTQYLDRLNSWRRDRLANPSQGDRILGWIDRELASQADPKRVTDTPLMLVRLNRTDLKAVARRDKASNRMLRLGWLLGLPEVETMPMAELSAALEGRGFAPGLGESVSVEKLLPPQPESEERWLIRRAATEITNDPGGRFLRYQGLVLPEPAPGEAPPAAASLNVAISGLKQLLGEAPVDPLPDHLRELGRKGRIGAVLTRLEMAPDFSSVVVEATLLVRVEAERWVPALAGSASVRLDDLPAEAGNGLADDPQVKSVLGLVESLGLGEIPPDLKRRSLGMGAATQKALGQARGTLDQELGLRAFSLEPASEAQGQPGANRPGP
ncbi:hypothetical protein P12x_001045 [Tundrisphaera lichenicola]|uniref:hypothetical protein n=1 Tax=Tundrisphaera lichenicola TaxID=2029860 RepID=UPI003EB9211E